MLFNIIFKNKKNIYLFNNDKKLSDIDDFIQYDYFINN